MTTLTREQLLVLVCPLFVIGGGYNFLYLRDTLRAQASADKALVAAEQKAPQLASQLTQLLAEERRLNAEFADLQSQHAVLQTEWESLQRRPAQVDIQITVELLGGLLRRHGLYVREAAFDAAAPLPAALRETLHKLAPNTRLQSWRFEVIGSYSDIREVLQALGRGEAGFAVPVGLAMEKASLDVSLRKWTLVVAM